MSKKVPVGKNKLAMEMMNVSHTVKKAAERLIASKTFDDDDDDNNEFGEEPVPGISRFVEIEAKAATLRRKQRSHSLFSRKRSAISTTTRSHKKPTHYWNI